MVVRTMETAAGGAWTGGGSWVEVFDPVDVRQPVARVPALTAAQVTGVYEAPERGFAAWRRTPALERARILAEAASLLRVRAAEIALGVVTENGKTLWEARGEVEKAADFFEYYAGQARQAYGSLVHDKVATLRPGPGQEAETAVGPLVSRSHRDGVHFHTRVKSVATHHGR